MYQIITSLLDTDLYQLTVMQAVWEKFPNANVKYKLFFRKDVFFSPEMAKEVSKQIKLYCDLKFGNEELDYLKSLPFIKDKFINKLKSYCPKQLQLVNGHIKIRNKKGHLSIDIEGPWLYTILFEVPVLAIVNEVYFHHNLNRMETEIKEQEGVEKLLENKKLIRDNNLRVAEFGTRRRWSKEWQNEVVLNLFRLPSFIGTSNVHLAMKYDIKPIGTMSHQWIMAGVGLAGTFRESQSFMLNKWVETYRGDLGIALTDTYGTDAFCKDFDMYFAKLYDGVRQDSGDPIEWGNKMIAHYESLGIDPKSKSYIFSDGLTVERAKTIRDYFNGYNVSFGIGTSLTNNFASHDALNVVFKMTECNGVSTVKLSDTPGKEMCEDVAQLWLMKTIMKEKVNGRR
jgi:nicotinate phosphoribosyltransferase